MVYVPSQTHTLLQVASRMNPTSDYWLGLCFNRQVTSDKEKIDFEKLSRNKRVLAPFAMPMANGKPIVKQASRVMEFAPGYIKLKDTYNPQRAISRPVGNLLTENSPSPEQNYQSWKGEAMQQHRQAIERTWEWMAAQAILNGAVTVEGEGYPKRYLDFGRNSNQTITLGSGSRWGDSGVDILALLQQWSLLMHRAEYGGAPNRVTMGTKAYQALISNAAIREEMNNNYRGNAVNLTTGLLATGEVVYAGSLRQGLDVYVYNDYYEDASGTIIPFMDERDIVLTGPAVDGVRAFGAIMDAHAKWQALPFFPREYMENDPAIPTILSQSAPLMVPISPNATLRARVVA